MTRAGERTSFVLRKWKEVLAPSMPHQFNFLEWKLRRRKLFSAIIWKKFQIWYLLATLDELDALDACVVSKARFDVVCFGVSRSKSCVEIRLPAIEPTGQVHDE